MEKKTNYTNIKFNAVYFQILNESRRNGGPVPKKIKWKAAASLQRQKHQLSMATDNITTKTWS